VSQPASTHAQSAISLTRSKSSTSLRAPQLPVE
jgi:hypothetical protein